MESTWHILRDFGFMPDSRVVSDPPGGLSYRFLDFDIQASACTSLIGPVVLLSGVYAARGKLAEIEIELPRELEDEGYVAAYLSYRLDRLLGAGFEQAQRVPWLELGRRNHDLLPWEVARVSHELRPHCIVDRDWLRLALRDLRDCLATMAPDETVRFEFDGEVFRIRAGSRLIVTPANGNAWPSAELVRAGDLAALPKRLMQHCVGIEPHERGLLLARRVFKTEPHNADSNR